MGRLPPSPCRACGSDRHWDKECPKFSIYLERRKTANLTEAGSDRALDEETVYTKAFDVLMAEYLSAAYIDLAKLESDIQKERNTFPQSSSQSAPETRNVHGRTRIEEVPDVDEDAAHEKLKASVFLIEDASLSEAELRYEALYGDTLSSDRVINTGEEQDKAPNAPPTPQATIKLQKRRVRAEGQSAFGESVLSTIGHIGSRTNAPVDLRIDSCANITLISETYYRALPSPPRIKQGRRAELWQLTNASAAITGFVTLPIFMTTSEGDSIETEAEAYVVPGMAVPILLGEDYQQNYELGVSRNVELGTTIHFGNTGYTVPAQGLHQRNKARRQRQKEKFGKDARTIRAAADYRISAHATKTIGIDGYFEGDAEYVLDKSLIANADESFFAVPNVLFSGANPGVPVSNPTDHPRMVRKGEVIGTITRADEYFDVPRDLKRLEDMLNDTARIATII
ncbi:hypothetical protein PLICRDRAFT_83614, partial [Plicaturopsis crispa FD-325 SS-3]